VCHYPACADDEDCGADAVCLPAGAFGNAVATCASAGCHVDGDCTTSTGGECTVFAAPYCTHIVTFVCTYDDDECRVNEDCAGHGANWICVPDDDGDGAVCAEDFGPPP
jgi:hypothetical protein